MYIFQDGITGGLQLKLIYVNNKNYKFKNDANLSGTRMKRGKLN
jgi:hypothetical protein